MFDKIEYKLLISGYMTKDEYKNLINKYMDEFNISYITAKQYISRKQKKQFEQERLAGSRRWKLNCWEA